MLQEMRHRKDIVAVEAQGQIHPLNGQYYLILDAMKNKIKNF